MAKKGVVSMLIDLLISGNLKVNKNIALCLATLSAMDNIEIRTSIMEGSGLHHLLQFPRKASNTEAIVRARRAINASPTAAKLLSSSLHFFTQLTNIIKYGSPIIQQTIASLSGQSQPQRKTTSDQWSQCPPPINIMECPKAANE
ncbi:hypothetical protein Cni_G14518 [Canna indica]|uniref:ARM repeat superfamily protein n=1 Tax=Canna indica TaxID=4628 RepID=A0AAQ3KCA8_9LILI|nr:hypothetical protein Cni_G14518 [Canna indica]